MSLKKTKVLITGAAGLLGCELIDLLTQNKKYTVIAIPKKNMDITDQASVATTIAEAKPDIIINCAAFTNVEACEDLENQKLAFAINAEGPKNLAIAANKNNCRLIHISTDYVFNKQTNAPIKEDETTNPCNFYGYTKASGEENILKHAKDALIIRTSWLYGHGGKNFIDTIINKALNDPETLHVINDQFGRPTYVYDLAQTILNLFNYKKSRIINVSNNGQCCWYELAKKTLEIYGIDHPIEPVSSDMFITKAKRPKYAVLCLEKLSSEANISPRGWDEALKEYILKEKREKDMSK